MNTTANATLLTTLLAVLGMVALMGCTDAGPAEGVQAIEGKVVSIAARAPDGAVPATPQRPRRTADLSKLANYQPLGDLSGNLTSTGSDTLANLVSQWATAYRRFYPSVNVQIQAAGSASAVTALLEQTAQFGPMSRAMRELEAEAFVRRHGYAPTGIRVAFDSIDVFVHKDNPLQSLSIQQVDAIFSATRRCGYTEDLRQWGQLGLTGSWQNRPIQLYGRNTVSGTYSYFKTRALCDGDFRNRVNEQPGATAVAQAVSSSLNGIGYSSLGQQHPGTKSLQLYNSTSSNAGEVLTRPLYIYVNKKPGEPLPVSQMQFLRYALSREGQKAVMNEGFLPLRPKVATRELEKLL